MEQKITASDAAKIAKNSESQKLGPILATIRSHAEIGKYECRLYSYITKTVEDELKALGYGVTIVPDPRNSEVTITITWK